MISINDNITMSSFLKIDYFLSNLLKFIFEGIVAKNDKTLAKII